MSDIQTDLAVDGNAITGTLLYLDSGEIADYWGAGNFMALKFTNNDSRINSIRVGLDPSEGSGLVELDSDMNGVFKVTNKDTQSFVVESTDGTQTITDTYVLSGLTVESE